MTLEEQERRLRETDHDYPCGCHPGQRYCDEAMRLYREFNATLGTSRFAAADAALKAHFDAPP